MKNFKLKRAASLALDTALMLLALGAFALAVVFSFALCGVNVCHQ
jgi:hypothetical protein